jgi:hypothetical protein
MLLGGQWPIDPGRTDLEVVGVIGRVHGVQQLRCSAGQFGDSLEIQWALAVGDDPNPGRSASRVDRHILDLVSGAGELPAE